MKVTLEVSFEEAVSIVTSLEHRQASIVKAMLGLKSLTKQDLSLLTAEHDRLDELRVYIGIMLSAIVQNAPTV